MAVREVAAAQILAQACQIVLDETQDPVTLLERIYTYVPSEHLRAAATTVGELTRPPDDNYAQELLGRYLTMRRFLPHVLAHSGIRVHSRKETNALSSSVSPAD